MPCTFSVLKSFCRSFTRKFNFFNSTIIIVVECSLSALNLHSKLTVKQSHSNHPKKSLVKAKSKTSKKLFQLSKGSTRLEGRNTYKNVHFEKVKKKVCTVPGAHTQISQSKVSYLGTVKSSVSFSSVKSKVKWNTKKWGLSISLKKLKKWEKTSRDAPFHTCLPPLNEFAQHGSIKIGRSDWLWGDGPMKSEF